VISGLTASPPTEASASATLRVVEFGCSRAPPPGQLSIGPGPTRRHDERHCLYPCSGYSLLSKGVNPCRNHVHRQLHAGTLANHNFVFTIPFRLSPVRVSASGSNVNNGILDIGNTTTADAYVSNLMSVTRMPAVCDDRRLRRQQLPAPGRRHRVRSWPRLRRCRWYSSRRFTFCSPCGWMITMPAKRGHVPSPEPPVPEPTLRKGRVIDSPSQIGPGYKSSSLPVAGRHTLPWQ
jgi:hypothetical protein